MFKVPVHILKSKFSSRDRDYNSRGDYNNTNSRYNRRSRSRSRSRSVFHNSSLFHVSLTLPFSSTENAIDVATEIHPMTITTMIPGTGAVATPQPRLTTAMIGIGDEQTIIAVAEVEALLVAVDSTGGSLSSG